MASQELKSAIEKPAEKAGLCLEEGLARTLLNEARVRRDGEQSAVLPFLQYALLATWQRRSGNTLTLAGYEAAGRSTARSSTLREKPGNRCLPRG